MVIATGFATTTTAPLDLDRLEPQPVDGFPDLIFEQSPHGKFFLGFDVDGPRPFQMAATIQHVAENRTAFVSDLTLRASDIDVVLAWQPAFHVGDGPYSYEVRSSDRPSAIRPVAFQGLCPQADGVPELRDLRGMDLSLGPIRYLSAYRDRPERQHRLPLGTPQRIGQQGQGTLGILAHDQERGGGDLLGMVNERLQLIVPGWRLEEIEAGPLWSTVLTRRGSRVRVNLADAGSGLAQMLPILVQCALDEQRGRNVAAPLQIIEEPEMHLHPRHTPNWETSTCGPRRPPVPDSSSRPTARPCCYGCGAESLRRTYPEDCRRLCGGAARRRFERQAGAHRRPWQSR
ncbi:hypothetical protein NKG94_45695 [Micromonospora sp. M12]